MMRRRLIDNRGVALIVVILIISVIVAVTLEFNRNSRASVYESANLADQIKIRYLAKSGFNAGVAILLEDKDVNVDALTEDWALPEVIAAKTAGLFEEETVKISIVDESGKINVNKLDNNTPLTEVLKRLLRLEYGMDDQTAGQIVDAVKDWIDGDSERRGGGSESSYFTGLGGTFKAKDKPLDCIDEILMISGFASKLYYGTKEVPGIGRYLTVHGNGQININTAPLPVLRALFKNDVSMDVVLEMDEYRKTQGAELEQKGWYTKISSALSPEDTNLITTKSDCFEIIAVGRLNNMIGQVQGVVKRPPPDRKTVTLYSWRSE